MVKHLLALLAGLALLSACASVPERPAAAGQELAIVGVTVIPMTGGRESLADQTVLIREGRISVVGPRRAVRVPAGARTIDGSGRFLMPGLADAHVHLEYIEDPDVLKLFLANGVTTVRSMDGRPFIRDWRDRVETGALTGPRIVTAGPVIDGSPPAREDNLTVADPAAARAAVTEQKRGGYDFIKAYSNLSPQSYEAIVAEAGLQGMKVAGHVPRGVKLERAMQSLWSLEHLGDFAAALAARDGPATPGWARRSLAAPLDQASLQALAQQLAAARVWVVPTAVQQDRWLARASEVERWLADPQMRNMGQRGIDQWMGATKWSARLDAGDWKLVEQARANRLAVISAFHKAGVRLLIGSDTPNPFVIPGASVHLELANFVAAGLTPAESLAAATIQTARMLGLEKEQGTVEAGKRADLLLLSANPLAGVGNASARVGLLVGGRWIGEQELQSMAKDLVRP